MTALLNLRRLGPSLGHLSLTFDTGGGGAVGYSWANTEARDWYLASVAAGATDDATDLEKGTADGFVTALKASGAWVKLEQINYLCAWHSIAARIDLKTATAKGSYVGGALHFRNRGVFCDGVDDEFDTQFNPSLASLFLQDDACMGLDVREDIQQGTAFMSTTQATPACLISSRNATDKIVSRLNSTNSTTITGTVSTAYGLVVANRLSGTTEEIYKLGSKLAANAAASTGRPNSTIRLGRSTSSYIRRQALIFFAGAGLTDATMQAAVNTAWQAVKDALGITVVYTATTGVPFTNAVAVPQVSQVVLPDGANAPALGKGLPGTGLSNAPDGTLWGGWGLGTMSANAGPVHFSAPASANDATVTLIQEYTTAALFAAIGYTPGTSGAANTYPAASSNQGVQQVYGGSAGNYNIAWVAVDSTNSKNYYCVANWNGSTLTAVSCSALPNTDINAVIPNDIRGGAWVLNSTAHTLQKATIAAGVLSLSGGAQITISSGGGQEDQMMYDADLDIIVVTTDPAGSGSGIITTIPPIGDYGRPYCRVGMVNTLTAARQIEGIAYFPAWNRVASMNDQYTHLESAPNDINCLQLHGPITLLAA